MKTIKINLYKFEELSNKAKQNSIKSHQDINVDCEWWDFIFEDWTSKLEALGYNKSEIMFNGFGSQGDGASFTTDSIDLWTFIKAHKLINKYKSLKKWIDLEEVTCGIVRIDNHYFHAYSVTADMEATFDSLEAKGSLLTQLEAEINEQTIKHAKELYKELNDSYDYLTSDEQISETLIANDYYFLKEGGQIQNTV
jgi:hypothetical protein